MALRAAVAAAAIQAACSGAKVERETEVRGALGGVSSASVSLQELTNSCGANQAQDFFDVTNTGATPLKVSDLSIKLWVNDTSGSNVAPQINTGGCLADATGSCVHQVTGVTATPARFSPACGPDAGHQANWEITISSTDGAALGPGLKWSNIQLALHLASFGNFSPGTGTWYSQCLPGTAFTSSSHFAVYVGGKLVTGAPGVPPACRAPHGSQTLSGHIPPGVSDATLVGSLPSATPLTLVIGLPLRNRAAAEAFAQQLYDPASPQFRHYLTPDQFAASYGATQPDYDALAAFARSKGLTVVTTYPSRQTMVVSGPASAVESAFFVTLNRYRRPDGTTMYAPANEPSLDLNVAIAHITGLTDFAFAVRANGGGGTGSGLCGGIPAYGGPDYRNIYFPGCSGLDGTNQVIGLFEMADYYNQDIADYTSAFGLGTPSVTRVSLDSPALTTFGPLPNGCTVPGITGTAGCKSSNTISAAQVPAVQAQIGGEGEVAGDIEMVLSMAPRASVRVYESGSSTSDANALVILSAMINEPPVTRPSVISSSLMWLAGTPNSKFADAFLQLAMQGQAFFQASGDSGAFVPGGGMTAVFQPLIDSTYITAVGGTALTTTGTGAGTTYASETAWNASAGATGACALTTCSPNTGFCGCNLVTSGGLCNGYTICATSSGVVYVPLGTSPPPGANCGSAPFPSLALPGYQAGLPAYLTDAARTAGQLSTSVRMVPDVAMVATQMTAFSALLSSSPNGSAVLLDPVNFCVGGTSFASPLWAAVVALANQQRQQLFSLPPLGFVNPTLYAAASGGQDAYSGAAGAFHDVTTGNNVYAGNTTTPTSYQSLVGYDLVTGLGTPNGKNCTPLNTIPPQSCGQVPSATPGVATDVALPTQPSMPSFITKGRDCAVWFSEITDGKIGRVAPDGTITEYDIPGWVPQFSLVLGLTAGPDGNIYFAAELNTVQHIIGKLEPATGAVTSLDVTAAAGIINTFQVAAARDGTIWFTTRSNRIGAVNPSLTLVEAFPLPNTSADTYGITLGPDGNMWFTDAGNNQLGRITPLGDVRTFGALSAAPMGIAAGPDSRIWFVEELGGPSGNGAVGAASLDGTILGEIPLASQGGPIAIAAGPDGNMWFTEDDGDLVKIGKVTTAMPITISEFNVATQPPDVFRSGNGITAGPDGNVWFTEGTVGRIGKITPP